MTQETNTPEFPAELSKVQERALNVAREAGRTACEKETKHFLADYSNIFTNLQVNQALEVLRVKTEQEKLDEILKGLHNSRASGGLGLSAIIRSGERLAILERIAGKPFEGSLFAPQFETLTSTEGRLERLIVPRGRYEDIGSSILFFAGTWDLEQGFHGTMNDDYFGMSDSSVVQIESVDGAFWQNPRFDYKEPFDTVE
jgi:hypothetical protein